MSEDRDRISALRLARSEGVGPVTYAALLRQYGKPEAALAALPAMARKVGRHLMPPSIAQIEDEFAAAAAIGAQIVLLGEPNYPKVLAQLSPAPPCLTLWGNPAVFAKPGAGLVGTRNASGAGLAMARQLARDLGNLGFSVVSGLARGIDGAAHAASLSTGTIAAVAGGVDHIYPAEHEKLASAIRETGAIVSTEPLGAAPRAKDFPRRNFIIAGLSLGIVVVEAPERSGALITARAAAEQGREVMAVPGSPLELRARGCNALIRNGAILVENAEQVREAIGDLTGRLPLSTSEGRKPPAYLHRPLPNEEIARNDLLEQKIDQLLTHAPLPVATIAEMLGVDLSEVLSCLVILELQGRAHTLAGGLAIAAVADPYISDND